MSESKLLPIIASFVFAISPAIAQEVGEGGVQGRSLPEYVIGVEDVLNIVTWGESKLSMTARVRPDGRITLPLVNDIVVAGLTPDQVRQRITSSLSDFINGPNVTVIVEEIKSFRVYFLGEVAKQGPLQFYRPTRILQGIATAGGLSQFSKKQITIVREEHGVEQRIDVDYKKLMTGDPSQENILLKPGDVVLVK